mgnify:CR=1 FL=1|jgi:transketolase
MKNKFQLKNILRNEFASITKELIKNDKSSVLLIGDISHYLLRDTEKNAPDRFYNIGICEQATVSVAAGMAVEGMRPIVHTIAPFVIERAYEQIKVGLGYQKTDVTIVTVGGTYDYADLGCTHHCYSDIGLMRAIPGMEVYAPSSPLELKTLFEENWGNGNPKYFRLSAFTHNQKINITTGEINVIRKSKNNKYVFVTGHMLEDVLKDPEIGVLYVTTLSHINNNSLKDIKSLFNKNTQIYTVENHLKNGGLGDLISENFEVSVKRIGLDRKFITDYGSYEDLRKIAGMDTESILTKIK